MTGSQLPLEALRPVRSKATRMPLRRSLKNASSQERSVDFSSMTAQANLRKYQTGALSDLSMQVARTTKTRAEDRLDAGAEMCENRTAGEAARADGAADPEADLSTFDLT